MISSLLLILAQNGYAPKEISEDTILEQIKKLFDDATTNPSLVPVIEKINTLFYLNTREINTQIEPEYSGPFCSILGVHLESRCQLKTCPNQNTQYRWDCQRFGTVRNELPTCEVVSAIQNFSKLINTEVLNEKLPPLYEYCVCLTRCVMCGSSEALQAVTEHQSVCKNCLALLPGKLLRLRLEILFCRPISDIIECIIHSWHSLQEQAQVLSLSVIQLQELYEIFCINPTKYRLQNEHRFANPFHTRKKARPVIDGCLYRLYPKYVFIRRTNKLRMPVKDLNNALLLQANSFLSVRNLMLFNVSLADF